MFSTIQRPSVSFTWITFSLLPSPMSTNGSSSAPMWTADGTSVMVIAGLLVDEALRALPVSGSQRLLVRLAQRAERDGVGEVDRLGRVVGTLAVLHHRDELVGGRLGTRPKHHDGLHRLTPALVGDTDHGRLRHRVVGR